MRTDTERTAALCQDLRDVLWRQTTAAGDTQSAVPRLVLNRRDRPTEFVCQVYEPAFALIAQGSKVVEVAGATYRYGAAEWLLAPLNTPGASRVVQASRQQPYLSCMLLLDLADAQQMMTEHNLLVPDAAPGRAIATGQATADLLEAMLRLVRLQDTPQDIPVMARLLQREVLYRLLGSERGHVLRQIVTAGTQSHRTARAVQWLRMHFRTPLRVDELAAHAHMGVSTLHHHFRALTGLSPLQFQKQLRLFEARRLMLLEGMDAGSAAFATGYESTTQFSREYRRQFGRPPLRDITLLRAANATELPHTDAWPQRRESGNKPVEAGYRSVALAP